MRRFRLFFYLCLSLSLLLYSGCAEAEPPQPASPVRIACMGDSVTYGYGLDRSESYPAQLAALLGEGYTVENFGVNGAAVCDYRNTPAFAAAMEFEPDIILLMLGSNDTNDALWMGQDAFREAYLSLLDACGESGARVIVCTCVSAYPVNGGYQFGVNPDALGEVCDVIADIAAEQGLPLADLAAVTANHPDYYQADGVHPNADGAAAIAGAAASLLQE